MACAQPLNIPNPCYGQSRYYSRFDLYHNKWLTIPCGWCLNCRVDKRNFLEDCCDFLHGRYGYCAFVTFTYSDEFLIERCQNNKIPLSSDWLENFLNARKFNDKLRLRSLRHSGNFSLNRDDVRLFNYRLRQAVKRLPDCPMNNHNYKVLYVGEYGGRFQRPHLHALFFGLDYTSPLFDKCWKYGLVESDPIKNGAFRYVIDYLDKEVHGTQKKELYDDCGLVAPFMAHSVGFATDFVLSRLDEIRKNNGSYKISGGKLRPLPIYFKNKYNVRVNKSIALSNLRDKYFRQYGFKESSYADFERFQRDMSLIRFKHLREINRQRQMAVDDLVIEIIPNFNIRSIVDSLDTSYDVDLFKRDMVSNKTLCPYESKSGEFETMPYWRYLVDYDIKDVPF